MENLPNDIDALKAKIKSLLEQIQRLEAENAELRRRLELDSSNSHIQRLEAENAELRRRLGQDSSNSHKPRPVAMVTRNRHSSRVSQKTNTPKVGRKDIKERR